MSMSSFYKPDSMLSKQPYKILPSKHKGEQMGKFSLEEIFEVIEKEGMGVDLEMDMEAIEEVVNFIEDGLDKKSTRR